MLIIDAGSARKDLPHHFQENYTMRGEHDQSELPFNKMHLSIIQTKYIEEFIEDERNKDIKNSIGQLMYLFKNDTICGTIGIDERIQGVMKMHKEYMDSLEAERAYNKEREQMMIASEMSDAYDGGIKEGIKSTLSMYVQSRFQVHIEEELQSLSLEQLDTLSHKIYQLETIEEIKELIRNL